jgi:hypothetical protein
MGAVVEASSVGNGRSPERRKSWRDCSGRVVGPSGYVFGDLTKHKAAVSNDGDSGGLGKDIDKDDQTNTVISGACADEVLYL